MTDTGKSACVLFIRDLDRHVLCVSRKDGSGWCFPGGKVEANETPKIAACRETCEETGSLVYPNRLVLLHVGPSPSGRIVHLYYAHKLTREPRAVELGMKVAWFNLPTLLRVTPFGEFYRAALPDGIDHLRSGELLGYAGVGGE